MYFLRRAQKIGIAGGLGLVLLSSLGYNLPLLFLPSHRGSLVLRLAFVSALLSFSLCWAILIAAIARKRHWSADECFRFTAFSLMGVGTANLLILSRFAPIPFAEYTGFFATAPFFGSLARKMAFPQLKFGQPETPSLTILRLN